MKGFHEVGSVGMGYTVSIGGEESCPNVVIRTPQPHDFQDFGLDTARARGFAALIIEAVRQAERARRRYARGVK